MTKPPQPAYTLIITDEDGTTTFEPLPPIGAYQQLRADLERIKADLAAQAREIDRLRAILRVDD